jgi:argonaute-like protein implicated in RNA metabolism and viral defense
MKAKDRETAALRHASWTNNEETVNAAMELEAGEETLEDYWEERGIVDSEVAKIYKTSSSVATEESQSVVHIPEKGTEEWEAMQEKDRGERQKVAISTMVDLWIHM